MNKIVPIKGETRYTIILDPSVWIFDKRKIDLDHYTQTGEQRVVGEREVSGSYGIPFEPFLQNAEPLEGAKHVQLFLDSGKKITLTLEDAQKGILGFAKQGKPLGEQGPLLFYFGEEQFTKEPIPQVIAFEVAI